MNATTLQRTPTRDFELDSPSRGEANAGIGPWTTRVYLAVAFLLGVFRIWTIPVVGALPIGELLLLALLAYTGLLVLQTRRFAVKLPSPGLLLLFLTCQLIAFGAYIVSDLWWQSSSLDMVRGWLRMGFLFVDLFAFALLFGATPNAFLAIQIGACFSGVQALASRPLFGDYWKFGFGYPVTVAVILLASRYFGWLGACVASFAIGLIHAALDFRSFGGLCLLTGALLMIRMLKPATRKGVIIGGVAAALAIFPVMSSKLGQSTEGRSNRSNIERLAMLQAAQEGFAEHPFVGNGSWFSKSDVMENFLLIRAERARLTGGSTGFNNEEAGGTAIHSQILVSLAEGGIFGGLFFIVYGIGVIWALWYCLTDAEPDWLMPVKVFLLQLSLWDLFMSPFSGPARTNIAMTAAIVLTLVAQARSRSEQPYA